MSAVLALACAPFLVIFDGFVLSKMWAWFVTPSFGIGVPSLAVCCGLVQLGAFLTHQYIPHEDKSPLEMAAICLVGSLAMALAGWLIHLAA